MDLDRLDTLARSVATTGSRRSVLGLLTALSIGGSVIAFLKSDEIDAKDRRRRRKQRHDQRKAPGTRKHGKPRKPCKPDPIAQTCAGTCGSVTNNCNKPVDCGPCPACSATRPCPPCQTCDGGQCVEDASQDRSCCAGADGEQWCQAGACVAIPEDARATLAECTGRCDCVPYGLNGCFGGRPAFQEICGATRLCPLCELCPSLVSGCGDPAPGTGPAGPSFYCVFGGDDGSCSVSYPCPDPETQICSGANCSTICGIAAA